MYDCEKKKMPISAFRFKYQGKALYIIKTLVLHIISGKATVSHQADKGMHTYGVMIYAARVRQ